MEDVYRVFIVGDALYAETLGQMLASSGSAVIRGVAPTLEEAITLMKTEVPDVVIVANTSEVSQGALDLILEVHADLTIIRTDLNQDYLQVITCQRVEARRSDLLAAIATLPRRT
jgi:uncharacterized Rossmann fold enzyme